MAATIAAARGAFPGRRLVLVFQPHQLSSIRISQMTSKLTH
jgi:UDP-N-acetylmuramate--alanine ligase